MASTDKVSTTKAVRRRDEAEAPLVHRLERLAHGRLVASGTRSGVSVPAYLTRRLARVSTEASGTCLGAQRSLCLDGQDPDRLLGQIRGRLGQRPLDRRLSHQVRRSARPMP
jgi:hypothetical protein